MTPIQHLSALAKQSFNIAALAEAYRPEGIAIRMKSGLIVTGHSYDGINAANDALRCLKAVYNTRQPKSFDYFTIEAAVVMVEPKARKLTEYFKPSNGLIHTLKRTLPVDETAMLYISSSQSKETFPPIKASLRLGKNLALDRNA